MSGPNHPRGTTNGNVRGNSKDRLARRQWLVATYQADVDLSLVKDVIAHAKRHVDSDYDGTLPLGYLPVKVGEGMAACRCYRCGRLLTVETVTVDRIVPGCRGGTYRRNNIRPACGPCNSETGGALARRAA